jgi:hypothetical protein
LFKIILHSLIHQLNIVYQTQYIMYIVYQTIYYIYFSFQMVLVTCNCLNIKLHLKQNPNISPFDLLPGNYKLSVCLSTTHFSTNSVKKIFILFKTTITHLIIENVKNTKLGFHIICLSNFCRKNFILCKTTTFLSLT